MLAKVPISPEYFAKKSKTVSREQSVRNSLPGSFT